MQKAKSGSSYFFVDESGDPVFYDAHGNCIVGQNGCSPILILGFIETQDPHSMRGEVLRKRAEVIADPYLNKFAPVTDQNWTFHAKDDGAAVRHLFYKLIAGLDFKAQFIVARKIERIFRNNHKAKENKYYDNLVTKLFQNVLHRFADNHITFSKRGSRDRRKKLEGAIWRAKKRFEINHAIDIDSTAFTIMPETPLGEPCLTVIDYLNWAVYRAFTKRDMRHYEFISEKVSFLRDVYDFSASPYHRKNPFEMNKAAPLELDS